MWLLFLILYVRAHVVGPPFGGGGDAGAPPPWDGGVVDALEGRYSLRVLYQISKLRGIQKLGTLGLRHLGTGAWLAP